jgi:hypothetical protein
MSAHTQRGDQSERTYGISGSLAVEDLPPRLGDFPGKRLWCERNSTTDDLPGDWRWMANLYFSARNISQSRFSESVSHEINTQWPGGRC